MNPSGIRLGVTGAVGLLVVAATLAAKAQEGTFYMNVEAGPAVTTDAKFKYFLPSLTPPVNGTALELDPGIHLGIGGGYYFTDWLALEMESGVYANHIDGFKGAREVRTHDSTFGNVPFMANAVFEVPNDSRLIPFAGAGIGGSISYIDADYMEDDLGPFLDGHESDFVLAYQFFGGLRYSLNEQMYLSINYRYFSTEGPEWDVDGFFGRDYIALERVETHSFNFSFSMRF